MAKVLIVDDSPAQVTALKKLVEDWGYETLSAQSGDEAIQIARKEQPNVILMDIVMPGMSGYEAKRSLALEPSTTQIPVIFVSSRNADSDRMWGMRLGAAGYVTKPVSPDALDSAIDDIVAA